MIVLCDSEPALAVNVLVALCCSATLKLTTLALDLSSAGTPARTAAAAHWLRERLGNDSLRDNIAAHEREVISPKRLAVDHGQPPEQIARPPPPQKNEKFQAPTATKSG